MEWQVVHFLWTSDLTLLLDEHAESPHRMHEKINAVNIAFIKRLLLFFGWI